MRSNIAKSLDLLKRSNGQLSVAIEMIASDDHKKAILRIKQTVQSAHDAISQADQPDRTKAFRERLQLLSGVKQKRDAQ
jgi:hypothetical protein